MQGTLSQYADRQSLRSGSGSIPGQFIRDFGDTVGLGKPLCHVPRFSPDTLIPPTAHMYSSAPRQGQVGPLQAPVPPAASHTRCHENSSHYRTLVIERFSTCDSSSLTCPQFLLRLLVTNIPRHLRPIESFHSGFYKTVYKKEKEIQTLETFLSPTAIKLFVTCAMYELKNQ